jgi:hypothetical protein
VRKENRDNGLVAVLGHDLVEPAEALVGNASALAKAAHDLVLDRRHQGYELGGHGKVVG